MEEYAMTTEEMIAEIAAVPRETVIGRAGDPTACAVSFAAERKHGRRFYINSCDGDDRVGNWFVVADDGTPIPRARREPLPVEMNALAALFDTMGPYGTPITAGEFFDFLSVTT